jgi:Ras family protein T1
LTDQVHLGVFFHLQVVDMALRQADVVVVCFDATKQATLDSVRASWYPRIQRLNPDVPVIMACCKADKLSEEREVAMLREVRVPCAAKLLH